MANIVRKNNTLHHYSTLSRVCNTSLQYDYTAHLKYSNCIRYNFFIFCSICMKFSHNILNTYSFIFNIIKHNWKIRRFWVVDPLKQQLTDLRYYSIYDKILLYQHKHNLNQNQHKLMHSNISLCYVTNLLQAIPVHFFPPQIPYSSSLVTSIIQKCKHLYDYYIKI